MSYNPDFPVVLGLTGEALTGKTITAKTIAPAARTVTDDERVWWTRLYFAMPLYEMATIKTMVEGDDSLDRVMYGIHAVLQDVWPSPLYGGPPYDELVEMVYDIASYPMPSSDMKPRRFLQWLGTDLCRTHDPDCWVNWMKRSIQKEYSLWRTEHANTLPISYSLDDVDNGDEGSDRIDKWQQELEERVFGVVIDDLRFPNEAEMIKGLPNGLLVKFTGSREVRARRALERDGRTMTEAEMSHASEASVNQIPEELFDVIIDTSNLTIEEQVSSTLAVVNKYIGA